MNLNVVYGITVALFISFGALANEYAVENISAELMEDAHAVIRESHIEITVKNQSRFEAKHTHAITILNSRGRVYGNLEIIHDSFRSVRGLRATLYDKNGKRIRRISRKEFSDDRLNDGFSFYSDDRIITHTLSTHEYPVTIKYEYTIRYSSSVFLDYLWIPVRGANLSAENVSVTFDVPVGFEMRHKLVNTDIKPTLKRTANRKIRKWSFSDFNALVREELMPYHLEMLPHIFFSPNAFTYGSYSGNMQSWEEIGHWINRLNANRQKLDSKTLAEVKEITENISDPVEKIRVVYEYMQSRTRYVAITLGVGGYQPAPASEVARLGYGECKALSNFTIALLDAVGINAYYTIIRSGDQQLRVDPDFPSNYFNHVIVCVPLENDTIWLETTSPILPMGYIGLFNMNRYALVVSPQGGKLVRTPRVCPMQNTVSQTVSARLNDSGIADIDLTKQFNGASLSARILQSRSSDLAKANFFSEISRLNQVTINSINYQLEKTLHPKIVKNASLQVNNYARRAGERILFQPVLLQELPPQLAETSERRNDFRIYSSLLYTDSIFWELPKTYLHGSLPDNISYDMPFGTYSLEYIADLENNGILVVRRFKLNGGLFRADQYEAFLSFLRDIRRADRSQIILNKV